ncbi:IS630 family transposase (plasmid) [Deinococcus psychrotolerans]|uniref:IS630 family transposase n=1 Tax=Deinococcus psychrotolerans TaxID=2489213 RepID=A0A3G8YTM0_9DEIO|nr:IS630 family transposase [Deinococcus psychrotolerans]AZI44596.1 IS630 family transposase [Deinococcus psychrotolerans]
MNTVGIRGYSLELRTRIVALVLGGASPGEAAKHFSVHVDTVKSYLKRHHQNTLHIVATPTGRRRTVMALHEQQLLAQLETHRDATLQEHADMLETITGLKISYKTVDRVFRRHKITHKKTLVARERREELRSQFLTDLAPYLQTPDRLVFLDESGFHIAMTRGYSRAPSNERAVDRVPRNRGRNQTLICALSLAGPQAAIVLDGIAFEWYVREILCPTLKPGQVVVMDNLSSHHRASIRTLIQTHGSEVMFTSPYSPDFNPIELMFFKLKALVRGGAWRVVTVVTELYDAIGVALGAVSETDIQHWFKHAHPKILL